MKKIKKYITNRCHSVIIPNKDMLKILKEEPLLAFDVMFKEIEDKNSKPILILAAPEIEKFFEGMLGRDFYDWVHEKDENGKNTISGSIWGAIVKKMEGLEHVVIIGEETEDFEYEIEDKDVKN